jgi:hypothetical protein
MSEKSNSKRVRTIVIALLFFGLVGTLFYYYRHNVPSQHWGIVEGAMAYPGEKIPKEVHVCAENVETGELHCTDKRRRSKQYASGYGYRLRLAPGGYLFFSTPPAGLEGYRAYYTEFVTCGLNAALCLSHIPLGVKVQAGERYEDIDPIDWHDWAQLDAPENLPEIKVKTL